MFWSFWVILELSKCIFFASNPIIESIYIHAE